MKNYDYLGEYAKELEQLLYDLTPGGSEFVDDPQACAEWIRYRLSSVPGYIMRAKLAENVGSTQQNSMKIYVVLRKGNPDCAFTNSKDATAYCNDQNNIECASHYWFDKVELESEYEKAKPQIYEIEYDTNDDDWVGN